MQKQLDTKMGNILMLILCTTGILLLGRSLSMQPYENEARFTEALAELSFGQTEAYTAMREQLLTPKYALQDYGITLLITAAFFFLAGAFFLDGAFFLAGAFFLLTFFLVTFFLAGAFFLLDFFLADLRAATFFLLTVFFLADFFAKVFLALFLREGVVFRFLLAAFFAGIS
jgi:hypothetical protein